MCVCARYLLHLPLNSLAVLKLEFAVVKFAGNAGAAIAVRNLAYVHTRKHA
jgi:hypothetical protein